ncbi:MAG TPA: LptA/OstA family protein [Stellaceae bacterium]|nr:LptA/OstA family protein [Stellaceae bacterium]
MIPATCLPWRKLAAILPMLGFAMLPLAPARAQLGVPDSNAPVNIQADSGIEWQQNQQIYVARGNAVATRGTGEIHADTLIAHYREAKGGENNTEIYRIEAEGNVTIKRDNRVVVGDRADYDVDQGIGIVRGKALKMTTAADTVTARDTLEWYDVKQVAVARGDAVAVHNGRTIKADVLTAYMVKTAPGGQPSGPAQSAKAAPKGPPPKAGAPAAAPSAAKAEESKIDRVDAQGHVVVVSAQDIGRGDYGVYNADTGICTLLGNVVITRGKDVVTGQYAVMDMNKNISRIMPASTVPGSTRQRVQGVFMRPQNSGAAPVPDKKTP